MSDARRRLVPVLGLLAAAALALFASHRLFFYYRDNFSTHYPLKAVSAAAFRAGEIPLWNFGAGGGQPLAGNPNTLSFYPDNLLYLIAPPLVAFNLHFLLHLVAALAAMYALLRRLEIAPRWSWCGALLYTLSGVSISALAFYNLITAVALTPLAWLAAESLFSRPGWRSALGCGAAFGLLTLGSEPVSILGAAAGAAILGWGRLGRRTVAYGLGAVVVALVIAAPLLLAWSEIAGETERSQFGYSASTVLAASLTPAQLVELIIGPFRGLLTDLGPGGFRQSGLTGLWPPLFLSLAFGAVAVPALAGATGRASRYQWIALAMLFVGLGRFNPVIHFAVESMEWLRFLRYPEKAAIPLCAALTVCTTAWLAGSSRKRASEIAAGVGLVGVLLLGGWVAIGAEEWSSAARLRTLVGAALAAGVLTVSIPATRNPRLRAAVAALTLAPLLFWAWRSAPVDAAAPYLERSGPAANLEGARVWRIQTQPGGGFVTEAQRYRFAASMVDPLFGQAFGVRYALDRSPDGMYSSSSRLVQERAMSTVNTGSSVARWARLQGVDVVIADQPLQADELRLLGLVDRPAVRHFYAVHDPVARVEVIEELIPVRTVQEAVSTMESEGFDPLRQAAGPAGRQIKTAPARIDRWREGHNHLEIDLDAPRGALLLINETYSHSWRAELNGEPLQTVPLNIDRLGVIVPSTRGTLKIEFGRRTSAIAVTWLLAAMVLAAAAFVPLLRFASRRVR